MDMTVLVRDGVLLRETELRYPQQRPRVLSPQANRTGAQPRLPAETKAPPQPFNVREVTEFLSSRSLISRII